MTPEPNSTQQTEMSNPPYPSLRELVGCSVGLPRGRGVWFSFEDCIVYLRLHQVWKTDHFKLVIANLSKFDAGLRCTSYGNGAFRRLIAALADRDFVASVGHEFIEMESVLLARMERHLQKHGWECSHKQEPPNVLYPDGEEVGSCSNYVLRVEQARSVYGDYCPRHIG